MAFKDDALDSSEYFHGLLTDQDWIIRTVKSFEFLDLPMTVMKTSMTVDGPALLSRQDTSKTEATIVEMPLGMFPKSLFASFDVVGPDGLPLPLLRSDYDSSVAVGILRQEIVDQGVAPTRVTSATCERLYAITSGQSGENIVAQIEWMDSNADNLDSGKVREIFGTELYEILLDLDDIDQFLELLGIFGDYYIPIVQLRRSQLDGAFVIKYREVRHSPELTLISSRRALDYLWTPSGGELLIDRVNLGLSGSQHFRAMAPTGTVISATTMVEPHTGEQSPHEHMVHLAPRWASIYTRYANDTGLKSVRLILIPEVRSMMISALAALGTTSAVLGAGAGLQIADLTSKAHIANPRLENIAAHSSGAVIAMLLLLPSIYLLALVRRDEHGLASSLMRYPRYCVGSAALASLLSAIPAAFSMLSAFTLGVWLVSLSITALVIVVILRHWRCIERLQSEARATSWNRDASRGGP